MHSVHGNRRRDCVAGVSFGWDEPHTHEHPDPGLPAEFDGGGETPGVTSLGVESDSPSLRIGPGDAGVGMVAIRDVGGEHPSTGEAVLPGIVEVEGAPKMGAARESGRGAVDTRILDGDGGAGDCGEAGVWCRVDMSGLNDWLFKYPDCRSLPRQFPSRFRDTGRWSLSRHGPGSA